MQLLLQAKIAASLLLVLLFTVNNSVAFVDVVKFSIDLAFKMGPVIAKFTDKDVKPPFNNDKTRKALNKIARKYTRLKRRVLNTWHWPLILSAIWLLII